MNNNVKNFGLSCWRILSEVPGWPDAPRKFQLLRLLPIVLPLAAILLLILWNLLWHQPHVRAYRTTHQRLLTLEQEIAELRLVGSDAIANEAAARAAEAGQILLPDPKQLTPALEKLTEAARTLGWQATLRPLTGAQAAPPPDAPFYFLSARGKLVPAPGNVQPFPTLLALLEQLSTSNQWIDLIRLSLRADEQGRHSVEVSLRAGCHVSHEKIPQ